MCTNSKRWQSRSYIVVPSTVYARINSEFVDFGVENPGLVQILQPIHADILEGEECCAGNDDAIWPNAHIDDSLFVNPVKPRAIWFLHSMLVLFQYYSIAYLLINRSSGLRCGEKTGP